MLTFHMKMSSFACVNDNYFLREEVSTRTGVEKEAKGIWKCSFGCKQLNRPIFAPFILFRGVSHIIRYYSAQNNVSC